tara:strand:- start:689 stop:1267 length:579 start_codon:yes stop_codon:yes gene_type:complete
MTYASEADLLAADGMDDAVVTAEMRTAALEYADGLIDKYCGTSFVHKPFSVTLDGNGRIDITSGVLFPQTLISVTVSGVAVADMSGWGLHEDGWIIRDTGAFTSVIVGRNVVIAGTAGVSATPPDGIAWCALTIARQHILDQVSRIPDRALSVANEFGNIMLAQAGGFWRPTNLPDVNAVLNRHRHRPPGAR